MGLGLDDDPVMVLVSRDHGVGEEGRCDLGPLELDVPGLAADVQGHLGRSLYRHLLGEGRFQLYQLALGVDAARFRDVGQDDVPDGGRGVHAVVGVGGRGGVVQIGVGLV